MISRSTKGASKQRRELINIEISSIRDLLPLPEGVRKRLSQLQVMAICKAFIGKNNFFAKLPALSCAKSEEASPSFDFSQALPGFLLMASTDGRFLYLSDNIMEILGHSVVDFMTQSETIFDLFDDRGQSTLMELLSGAHGNGGNIGSGSAVAGECSLDEKTFTCLMGLTKNVRRHPGLDRQKMMKVRACLVKPMNCIADGEPVLVAFCSPCSSVIPSAEPVPVFNTMVCQTRHGMDMKFLSVDSAGEFHLGYTAKELQSRSWYEFIHPSDEPEFISKHLELISNGSAISSVFFRVQTRYGHFIWLHVIMRVVQGNNLCPGQSEIVCVSQVLNEEEVAFVRERELLEAEMSSYVSNSVGFDNQSTSGFPVDDGYLAAPQNFLPSTPLFLNVKEPGKKLKRKATGGDVYGKPRKMCHVPAVEDSVSTSSSCSSVWYSSPVNHDLDRSFQFAQMGAFPGSVYPDVYHPDMDLGGTEETFHSSALSPNSMLSDSNPGSSPRMYPEDDGSFFASMATASEQKISNVSKIPDDLSLMNHLEGELKTVISGAVIQPSPIQEVPTELPELDLTDLYYYLRTVEDGRRQSTAPQHYGGGLPSYTEIPHTSDAWKSRNGQPTSKPSSSSAVTYQFSGMQREEDKHLSRHLGSSIEFSGPAFLERLIESPQFTELIGMMASGSQKSLSFPEQGMPCFG